MVAAGLVLVEILGGVKAYNPPGPFPGGAPYRTIGVMSFVLATGSFFSLRSRVPRILLEPLTRGPMRTLPVLLLFGTMSYWLWRVRRRRPPKVVIRHDLMPLTAPAE